MKKIIGLFVALNAISTATMASTACASESNQTVEVRYIATNLKAVLAYPKNSDHKIETLIFIGHLDTIKIKNIYETNRKRGTIYLVPDAIVNILKYYRKVGIDLPFKIYHDLARVITLNYLDFAKADDSVGVRVCIKFVDNKKYEYLGIYGQLE